MGTLCCEKASPEEDVPECAAVLADAREDSRLVEPHWLHVYWCWWVRRLNWVCFFLCIIAWFETTWLGATTHGPIFQGHFIQGILLFFHVHVNLGFEFMLAFLNHKV